MTTPEAVRAKLDEIVNELKRLGVWRMDAPTPQELSFSQAFGSDTMPFTTWIQFILVPRVESILAENGEFPSSSMLGTKAVREFDGQPDFEKLTQLLGEFDALFD